MADGPFQDDEFRAGGPAGLDFSDDDIPEAVGTPTNAEFIAVDEMTGATLLKLDDCPATYEDQAGKWLRVNPGESAVVFDLIRIEDVIDLKKKLDALDVMLDFWMRFCRLGDRDLLAAEWTSASEADKQYLYLCDETTGQFSNGDAGKKFLEY